MDKAFEVHRLNSRGIQKAQRLAGVFDTNLAIIREIVGETNLLNHSKMELCVEHLELASFYAKKAIAMQFENQESANEAELKRRKDAASGPSIGRANRER